MANYWNLHFIHALSALIGISFLNICCLCQTTTEVNVEMMTVVEGDRTTLICDISTADENSVIWAHYDENDVRHYISLNDYVYPNHQGRVEVSIDRNTNIIRDGPNESSSR